VLARTPCAHVFWLEEAIRETQNWGEGYEYHLLALALAIPLMIGGAGSFSVDSLLAQKTTTSAADDRFS